MEVGKAVREKKIDMGKDSKDKQQLGAMPEEDGTDSEHEVEPQNRDKTSRARVVATKEENTAKKENKAFWLVAGSLGICAGMWVVDICVKTDSKLTDQILDLLKYVITSGLGFYFGTHVVSIDGGK